MSLTWTSRSHKLTRNFFLQEHHPFLSIFCFFTALFLSFKNPQLPTIPTPARTYLFSNLQQLDPPSAMSLLRPRHHLSTLTAFTFLLFFSASATTVLLSQLGSGSLQEGGEDKGKQTGLGAFPRVLTQKRHGGPGSSPPSCRSKCDKCSPCEPVHVPIQHGWRMPLEYYPEAWRCKCGNKLFMP